MLLTPFPVGCLGLVASLLNCRLMRRTSPTIPMSRLGATRRLLVVSTAIALRRHIRGADVIPQMLGPFLRLSSCRQTNLGVNGAC
jgi:hypothetical protein